MPFDVDKAMAAEFPPVEFSWKEDDVILYHLGLGAGANWTDESELQYTLEPNLKVLPTFAVIPVFDTAGSALGAPGIDVKPFAIVHGEHEIALDGPIPRAASVRSESRISGIYDRGTGAVIEISVSTRCVDTDRELFTNVWSLFARGEGGFGGEPGPKNEATLPDRAPDRVADVPVLPQQAQIYRLSGDKNPYHVDPESARKAGFDRPILHGLCSYGMICKAVVDELLDGDVARVARYRGRFAKPVFPGETIQVSLWRDGKRVLIGTETRERGTPVLTNAWVEVTE